MLVAFSSSAWKALAFAFRIYEYYGDALRSFLTFRVSDPEIC